MLIPEVFVSSVPSNWRKSGKNSVYMKRILCIKIIIERLTRNLLKQENHMSNEKIGFCSSRHLWFPKLRE